MALRTLCVLLVVILSPLALSAQFTESGIIRAASTDCATSNSCVALDSLSPSSGTVAIQLSGTFTATLAFEGTANGGTWTALSCTPIGGGASVGSATAAGLWQCSVGGLVQVRVRASPYASGGANVTIASSTSSVGGTSSLALESGGVLDDSLTALQAIQTAVEDTTATDVTLSGYLAVVSSGSSVTVPAIVDEALVTVATGTRIILHGFAIECSNTVTVAVTARLGFGTANVPADKTAGLIYEMAGTTPDTRGGINALHGWPNVEAVGGDGEDLRLTMSAPTGDACNVAYKYTLEAVE